MQRAWGLVVTSLAVTSWAVAGAAQTPARGTPSPSAPSRIDAGRKVYEREKCATCHQIANHGNSRFPLDGVASRLTPDQLKRWLTDTAKMEDALPRLPAVRMSTTRYRLSDADLTALVDYLKSLK
jgi:mono/diheme cytochrome c family protein